MYAKLFASLYQGTLRGCSDEILVFTNLLAHCGSDGVVDKHFRAISEETGLSIERVEAAIIVLESPDPESRSPAEEGRRIIKIDDHRSWGWRIVNHAKYRSIRSEEDRREQNRLAQQRWRDNKQNKPSVSTDKPNKPKQYTETEAYTDTEDQKHTRSPRFDAQAHLVNLGVDRSVAEDWLKVRKGKRVASTKTAFDGLVVQAELAGLSVDAAVRHACQEGWAGFKAAWMANERGSTAVVPVSGIGIGRQAQETAIAAQRFMEGMTKDERH